MKRFDRSYLQSLSRRGFIRQTSIAAAGAATLRTSPFIITERAAPDDPIRVGVIGCGGRGTGAAFNVLRATTDVVYPSQGFHTEDVAPGAHIAAENVEIVALADLFVDRLEKCRGELRKLGIQIADEACFTGTDGYRGLLAMDDVNYVILATPPHFRPTQLMAAVEAGKHVFMEKPAAVDGPGVRTVLAAGELAAQKRLGIVAGTQRRHDLGYVETVKRLKDGAIGKIHTCRAYWNGGEIWVIPREPGWTDMEWQLRNWPYFTWLSGDHIVEQHLHNLDVIKWILDENPVRARALGGRQVRTGEIHGHIYDHFAVEFEYESGARLYSQCRQINGTESMVEEGVEGSLGFSNCRDRLETYDGSVWRFRDKEPPNPYEQEHVDLIDSIRAGEPLNEARGVAESTLMGIMGRESAYSGQTITWEEALNSQMDLTPPSYEFGVAPFPEVAMPGTYRFS
jgi:predicted dehydrogenase